jgi:plastocyanin
VRAARFAVIASAFLFVAMAASAAAAVRPVDITDFKFVPQSVTITAGDTVTWTNRDAAAHSARVGGVGTTAVLTQGQSGSLVFMNAGNFPYDCGVHGSSMTGTVVVRAASTPQPTPVPTPPPTLAPTPRQTVAPTVAPTIVATPLPTISATPTASPPATSTTAATTAPPSATPLPSVAVVAPTEQAPAPVARDTGDTALFLAGVAVLALLAAGALTIARIKR